MRRLLTVFGALAFCSALALADSWTGRLLDASCYEQNKAAKGCDATNSSSTFAMAVSGKVYRLDEKGNANQTFVAMGVTLGDGADSLFHEGGTSLVIHAKGDDLMSDPSGNSGDRIACGVIEK